MDQLVTEGRLLVPEEVVREVYPSDDHAAQWIHERSTAHRATVGTWSTACTIADRYPDLVNLAKPRGAADPFVVALALDEREKTANSLWRSEVHVVTNERSHRPRIAIPDACDEEGIPCVDMYGWFDVEGWEF
jgi:hypothetical protein